jgi:hypothetical protein
MVFYTDYQKDRFDSLQLFCVCNTVNAHFDHCYEDEKRQEDGNQLRLFKKLPGAKHGHELQGLLPSRAVDSYSHLLGSSRFSVCF